jgi:hypothetical protein
MKWATTHHIIIDYRGLMTEASPTPPPPLPLPLFPLLSPSPFSPSSPPLPFPPPSPSPFSPSSPPLPPPNIFRLISPPSFQSLEWLHISYHNEVVKLLQNHIHSTNQSVRDPETNLENWRQISWNPTHL